MKELKGPFPGMGNVSNAQAKGLQRSAVDASRISSGH